MVNMAMVLIVIGSKSDQEYAAKCREQLAAFRIDGTIEVSSAHRHPQKTQELTSKAEEDGYEVIIAMAGLSAALPGVVAAHSHLPVIGVPLPAALGGIDALLSTVQMPPGIPVATVAIGSSGAKNAAVLAARILALKYPEIKTELEKFRNSL
jgi:5-(carboxyamino)imidazole ribonucleotide mutase